MPTRSSRGPAALPGVDDVVGRLADAVVQEAVVGQQRLADLVVSDGALGQEARARIERDVSSPSRSASMIPAISAPPVRAVIRDNVPSSNSWPMQAPSVSTSRATSDSRRIRATSRSTTLSEATAVSTCAVDPGPAAALGVELQQLLLVQRSEKLLQEERVAVRLAHQDLRQRTNRGGVQVQGVAEQARRCASSLQRRRG